jgi:hypothetical protein
MLNTIHEEKKETQNLIYETKKYVEKLFESFKEEMSFAIFELDLIVKKHEEKLEEQKIDASTVLKELQVYKKSMFIIEKKIENLYRLYKKLKEGDSHFSGRLD